MKKAFIFLAEGFEEMEAVTPLDLLRRVGIDTKFVSISDSLQILGAHNILFTADMLFEREILQTADILILPGGMPGTMNLLAYEPLLALLLDFHKEKKTIAAICAAPLILGEIGILEGKSATIYPGMENRLIGAHPSESPVCVDGHILTSRGAGTAIEFTLAIIRELTDDATANQLKTSIVYHQT